MNPRIKITRNEPEPQPIEEMERMEVVTENNAKIHTVGHIIGASYSFCKVKIPVSQCLFNADACRDAAEFFTTLAEELERKG